MLASEWKLEDALRVRDEEGIQNGRQEGKLETARNLKSFGFDLDQTARATSSFHDEIAKL